MENPVLSAIPGSAGNQALRALPMMQDSVGSTRFGAVLAALANPTGGAVRNGSDRSGRPTENASHGSDEISHEPLKSAGSNRRPAAVDDATSHPPEIGPELQARSPNPTHRTEPILVFMPQAARSQNNDVPAAKPASTHPSDGLTQGVETPDATVLASADTDAASPSAVAPPPLAPEARISSNRDNVLRQRPGTSHFPGGADLANHWGHAGLARDGFPAATPSLNQTDPHFGGQSVLSPGTPADRQKSAITITNSTADPTLQERVTGFPAGPQLHENRSSTLPGIPFGKADDSAFIARTDPARRQEREPLHKIPAGTIATDPRLNAAPKPAGELDRPAPLGRAPEAPLRTDSAAPFVSSPIGPSNHPGSVLFHAPVDGQTPHLSARFIGDSLGQAAKPQAQVQGGSVETRDHPSFKPTAARPLSPHPPSDEMLSRTVNGMDTGPAEHGDKTDSDQRGSVTATALSPLELRVQPPLNTTTLATATLTPSSATLPTQYRITKALAPLSVTLSVPALTEASVSENAPAVSPVPSKPVLALSSAGPLPDPTQGKTGQGQRMEGSLILPASVDPATHTAPKDRRAGLETVPTQPNPPMTQPVRGNAGSPESTNKTNPLTLAMSETMGSSDIPGAPGVAPSAAPEARVIAMQTPPPQPSAPPVTQQIVQAIGDLSRGPVELRMAPEELGAVRMTLTPTEQGLTLTIHADRDETAALLRRHLDQLAADFRDLGFRNLSFQFGSGGAGGSGAHDEPGNARVGVGDKEQQNQPAQYHTVNRADDRLDLRL